ncbi:MAG: hypothetical protein JRJ46_03805 [Deltaproteobacteria bacterium]|nr:hypothetical protein [Deltaproteobacteria bacterium]
MNRLSKITCALGCISLLTAIAHKLLINNLEAYQTYTGMAFIPFSLFLLFITIHFFYGILKNLFEKNFKQLLVSVLISFGFFIIWFIIMIVDKELFVYGT